MADFLVIRTVSTLRAHLNKIRRTPCRIAIVPTMGALHDGHMALVREAQQHATHVLVTIFVNPAQFSAHEDLSRYPRTEGDDIARLKAAGVDLVFVPAVEEIYPQNFSTSIVMTGPATCGLEDRFRPTHFSGVATIVAKLFCQSGADIAVFGEKDYQQLMVVTQMARDLDLPVRIIGLPTIRENDGLALSSRNRFLDKQERQIAPVLYSTMRDTARMLEAGAQIETKLADGRARLEASGFTVDYYELRHRLTLTPMESLEGEGGRLLAAARLGSVRLIDNIPVAQNGPKRG